MGTSSSIEEAEDLPPMMYAHPPKHVFASSSRERQDFARLWEQYVAGGMQSSSVTRPLLREVLLRAVRELTLSPTGRAWAEELVTNAVASLRPEISAEEAFGTYQALMQNLQPAHVAASEHRPQSGVSARPVAAPVASMVNNYARMPKGSRTVDPAPLRRLSSEWPLAGQSQKAPPRHEDLVGSTRAAQESTSASLRAAVMRSQGTYEDLCQADAHRDALSGTGVRRLRSRAVDPAQKVDMEMAKLHDQAQLIQQQSLELTTLRDGLELQMQRHAAASTRLAEAEEKLEEAQQENAELQRQHKTEELRATMLREAFEQEQNRVGVSLGQAETYVNHLVAATEGTRRVEMTEQAVARECVQALNEIHAAQSREDLSAEAKLNQLVRELELAKTDYDLATRSVPATSPKADPAKQTELSELRRGTLEAMALFRRRLADAQVYRRRYQEIQHRAEAVNRDLAQQEGPSRSGPCAGAGTASGISSTVPVLTRLRLEEAEEAQQKAEEARLESELVEAERGSLKQDFYSYQVLLDHGSSQLHDLQGELQQLRSRLSGAPRRDALRAAGAPPTPADNLMAAGLQRRVGLSLAAGRESRCLIQEEQLKRQLAEQRVVDRHAGRMEDLGATAEETLSNGAVIGPGFSGISAVDSDVGTMDASQELRARLAALRGQLNQGATGDSLRTELRPNLHEQLQVLREQLERS